MLGVQREQVALGDEMDESVIESVLCFQLSMQIQSSLNCDRGIRRYERAFLYVSRGLD
jgi:hypothetical protein